jgi:hypothetical protein
MKSFQRICVDKTRDDFSIEIPDSKFAALLAVGVEQTVTVPSDSGGRQSPFGTNQYVAIFKCPAAATVWYALNETAAVPSGTLGAVNVDMVRSGEGRAVAAGDVLHFVTSDTTAFVSVTFEQI